MSRNSPRQWDRVSQPGQEVMMREQRFLMKTFMTVEFDDVARRWCVDAIRARRS